jgi:hypothetical protein
MSVEACWPLTGGSGLAYALWRVGQQQGDNTKLLEAKKLVNDCYADAIRQPSRYVVESLLDGMHPAQSSQHYHPVIVM